MALKVTLSRSFAGASETQLRTLTGLGLRKMGQQKLLKDTPAVRGMVFKVQHLVHHEVVAGDVPARKRRKPRVARVREQARAAKEAPEKRDRS